MCLIRNVMYYITLKQAMGHGLVLKKIHRAISFQQEAWLEPSIRYNTEMRGQAKNDFGKDYFKLMNNSLFGKTMENVRKHKNIRLVNSERKRKIYASRGKLQKHSTFSDKFLATHMR